jgi:serine/threonine-protein kinase HipA
MHSTPDRTLLVAVLDGRLVGHVLQDRSGRYRFIYDEEWRRNAAAYPLSLSMPLSTREHAHDAVHAYLWGLLPDNHQTLEHYGRRFGVSAGNPAALLAHLGADCPGAVQFATPENAEAVLGGTIGSGDVEWLTESQVADDLRAVRTRGIPRAGTPGIGQFSLPGAQPKIALLFDGSRWGRPGGRVPTNTILKPPTGTFDGFAENEHLCLELARRAGMDAVRSRVLRFDDEVAIVVDRYDRITRDGVHRRVHQEDTCQALGIMPTRKYENEGGPGVERIVTLLRETSSRPDLDVGRFLDATILNWLLVATDGHAKNFALLHAAGGATRLAPFYDIASYLPYTEPALHDVKLAMRIGDEYLVRRIARREWEMLAKGIGVTPTESMQRIDRLVDSVRTSLDEVRDAARRDGLEHAVIDTLVTSIRARLATVRP